ncbi:MAG: non-heme iron oxygenase ferredoxin subunit [Rugosibacter sp.]|nr:MAG: non-heme iron oxygenase ferredoxin subunit [Rugosibacter sp.]
MSFIKVCRTDDIANGGMRRVLLANGTPVAIYRIGDDFFATSDYCTHGIASLTKGELKGDIIECPFHGGAFNCRTGEPVETPCTIPLECFKVDVRDGEIFVGRG